VSGGLETAKNFQAIFADICYAIANIAATKIKSCNQNKIFNITKIAVNT
jgi:hypothetical protein